MRKTRQEFKLFIDSLQLTENKKATSPLVGGGSLVLV